MKRVLFALVLVLGLLALIGAASADLAPGGSFTDDNGNIHEANIEAIAAAGITKGCNPPTNDRYCPDASVTRGQMAAFLVRALDLTDDGGGNTFVDDDGSIFESDIAKLAAAGITKGCNPPTNDRYCPDDVVRRDQMASFLARALDLDPIAPPPPAGVLFNGPLVSQPGLFGEISFEVSSDSTEVKNITIALDFDNYDCGGGMTRTTKGGEMTFFVSLPVTNGSFSYTSSTLTLSGSFVSPTSASGTVSGDEPMDPKCPWGPLSWSATSTGSPPPTSSTTTTTTTTTTQQPPPPGGWPPCDFAPFSISGSGPGVQALQVPSDKPAILDVSFSGTGTFWVDALDINSQHVSGVAFDHTGGVYQGVVPINHRWLQGYVRYLDFVSADGSWTVDVKPFCSAIAMTGNSISGTSDEVVLVNQAGEATVTHAGANYFGMWAHQSFTDIDLEVNTAGVFDDTVDIGVGTVFLVIEASDTDGAWSVTFP